MRTTILCLIAFLTLSGPAEAHSWYDTECCNENDCKPVKLLSIKNGVYSWRSWRKPQHVLSIHIDDKRVRPALDGGFHACEAPWADTSKQTPSPVRVHCVYIGAGG